MPTQLSSLTTVKTREPVTIEIDTESRVIPANNIPRRNAKKVTLALKSAIRSTADADLRPRTDNSPRPSVKSSLHVAARRRIRRRSATSTWSRRARRASAGELVAFDDAGSTLDDSSDGTVMVNLVVPTRTASWSIPPARSFVERDVGEEHASSATSRAHPQTDGDYVLSIYIGWPLLGSAKFVLRVDLAARLRAAGFPRVLSNIFGINGIFETFTFSLDFCSSSGTKRSECTLSRSYHGAKSSITGASLEAAAATAGSCKRPLPSQRKPYARPATAISQQGRLRAGRA